MNYHHEYIKIVILTIVKATISLSYIYYTNGYYREIRESDKNYITM